MKGVKNEATEMVALVLFCASLGASLGLLIAAIAIGHAGLAIASAVCLGIAVIAQVVGRRAS